MIPCLAAVALAAAPVEPFSDTERNAARAAIAAMRAADHGPYEGLLWFCIDGTTQPPNLHACDPHGGGHMYATFGRAALNLQKLGIFGGTILTPLAPEALTADSDYRARALIVEHYLEQALDGWVLERARTWRGFRQQEDEEYAARTLLIALAGQSRFVGEQRALLLWLSRSMPYGRGNESLAADIRAAAATLADQDPGFAALRFKIHSMLEPADAGAVEAAGQRATAGDPYRALAAMIRRYFDPAERKARLVNVRSWVGGTDLKGAIDALLAADVVDPSALFERGIAVMRAADRTISAKAGVPERNLLALHVMGLVEELWLGATSPLASKELTRRDTLHLVGVLGEAMRLTGVLSGREQQQLAAALSAADGGAEAAYEAAVGAAARALEWARARALQQLGCALERYQEVEPRAATVVDDLLRSSAALPLAMLVDRLSRDLAAAGGGRHHLYGVTASAAGVRGENPGIATGPLAVVPAGGRIDGLRRGDVALLYDLPPDLPPVAGVLTVGAVGSLSHVALLARNLGIPLASIDEDEARALAAHAGEQVVLGVSGQRRVSAGVLAALPQAERAKLSADAAPATASEARITIDATKLDLTTSRLLRLEEISDADKGVRVGSKAAGVARLHRLFPTRVADGAVIPFGAFVRHVDRPAADGGPSPLARLRAAYAERATAGSNAVAEARLRGAIEDFRRAILSAPFAPGFEAEVAAALDRLGKPGTFGVFVRSDTNVEDLKEFTGAGLNLTVSNRVGAAQVLASLRDVWASPFVDRALDWRQRLMTNPEHVYPSVLLHRTVPGEISGVLVTTDLETGDAEALTISAGEGVSAVVDGGLPETVVVAADGTTRLLASSRSSTRKVVPRPPAQGIVVQTTQGKDPLLTPEILADVRALAHEVLAQMPVPEGGTPWDIEYGVVGGKAFLMQIRSLRLARTAATHPFLVAMDARGGTAAAAAAMDALVPRIGGE